MKTTRQEAKKKLEEITGVKIDSKDFTYIVETKQKDGTTKEAEKVSIDKVADYLIEKYTFKTIYGSKSEKIFIYDGGLYLSNGREIIKTKVEELLGLKARINIVNEVFEKIKRKTAISQEEFYFIDEGLVCLENGIYNLKEKKFLKHDPKYYFKSKLPIHYNSKADCPKIKKFFEEILYDDDVLLMQEWIGFNLYNLYFEKKAIILFGDTNTGKTITIDLLSKFIGEKNTTSLSLQQISYGKSFDLLDLKDKYSNVYDDLGDKDINDTGGFKIATGGSSITGEEKFGDRIKFRTFSKLTFATNKIPATKDVDDDAYYLRWMPIRLDNQISIKDQDKFLIQKLTTKEEISGLFNWAIKGFNRLIKNNGFSFEKNVNEIKNIMQRSSHHLTAFAQDCLEEKIGNKITKEEMFSVYLKWCKKQKVTNFSKDKLGKNLSRFVSGLDSVGGKKRLWVNSEFTSLIRNDDTFDTFLISYRELKCKEKEDKKKQGIGFVKGVIPVTKEDDKIETVKIK